MIEIRKASLEDIDQLSKLFDLYRMFYRQPSNVAACREFLMERLQRNESVVLIAVKEGNVVGFIQFYPLFSSVGLQKTWLLNDVYVQEKERQHGIGSVLARRPAQDGCCCKRLMTITSPRSYTKKMAGKGWMTCFTS